MSKPILVSYDPSAVDHAPIAFGVEVARLTGASLLVASVEGLGSNAQTDEAHATGATTGSVSGSVNPAGQPTTSESSTPVPGQ